MQDELKALTWQEVVAKVEELAKKGAASRTDWKVIRRRSFERERPSLRPSHLPLCAKPQVNNDDKEIRKLIMRTKFKRRDAGVVVNLENANLSEAKYVTS